METKSKRDEIDQKLMITAGSYLKGTKNIEAGNHKLYIDPEYFDIYYEGRFMFGLSITNNIPENIQNDLCKMVFKLLNKEFRKI